MSEDDDREEEASNVSNEMTDAAQHLMDEYGWSLDDVLDTIRSVVGG